jgi:uncharacterized protein DUF3291
MSDYHLAQINVATIRFPLEDPRLADFVALLDPIHALADAAPGFVWRLEDDGGVDVLDLRPVGVDVLINMSVWESLETLWDFTYRSGHLDVMRRRREWMDRQIEAHLAMWWIPAGHIPTVAEGVERLALLRAEGPSPRAFHYRTKFTAEEAMSAVT